MISCAKRGGVEGEFNYLRIVRTLAAEKRAILVFRERTTNLLRHTHPSTIATTHFPSFSISTPFVIALLSVMCLVSPLYGPNGPLGRCRVSGASHQGILVFVIVFYVYVRVVLACRSHSYRGRHIVLFHSYHHFFVVF